MAVTTTTACVSSIGWNWRFGRRWVEREVIGRRSLMDCWARDEKRRSRQILAGEISDWSQVSSLELLGLGDRHPVSTMVVLTEDGSTW
ncbi:hypothetical protein L484_017009 [Morus notabilis]|uniref:Uncharacterized protein n=1 Tax=Morus notabilis TaxID=981085 RepID=W9RLC2_9ROSA|nr:hypothetical protein L484_017009 [Morus notabilis]